MNNAAPYFAWAVSYGRKMFKKLAIGKDILPGRDVLTG
jgi:hypothetical protein